MGPAQLLRNLALSLERVATQEAASSAVQGAARGLRAELPDEVEAQVHALLRDTLTVLGRLVHEAAHGERPGPEAAAHAVAGAAMSGALEALEREWNDGGMPLHGLLTRVDRLLDHVGTHADARRTLVEDAEERARAFTYGVVDAGMDRLHESLPQLTEDLRGLVPLGGEVAASVGRGLVEGLGARAREDEAVLGALLEKAGQRLVHGLATAVEAELRARPGAASGAVGAAAGAVEAVAERAAAATVRGAVGELVRQAGPLREALALPKAPPLREASRQVAAGLFDAVGERLRGRWRATAGMLLAAALFSVRRRRPA